MKCRYLITARWTNVKVIASSLWLWLSIWLLPVRIIIGVFITIIIRPYTKGKYIPTYELIWKAEVKISLGKGLYRLDKYRLVNCAEYLPLLWFSSLFSLSSCGRLLWGSQQTCCCHPKTAGMLDGLLSPFPEASQCLFVLPPAYLAPPESRQAHQKME